MVALSYAEGQARQGGSVARIDLVGVGKTLRNDGGDEESLSAFGFSDSHYQPQLMAAYVPRLSGDGSNGDVLFFFARFGFD